MSAFDRPAASRGSLLDRLDHLVIATPELERTVDDLEDRLGVRATAGGQHPGRGTRNALLALGERSYLEVVGPDPEQATPPRARWFGIDLLAGPRLVAWAANGRALDRAEHPSPSEPQQVLRVLGIDLPVTPGPQPALVARLEGASGPVEVR